MEYAMSKTYDSIFILDISKLARLLNIIEERFKSIDLPPIASFEITTKKGKTFYASDIEGIIKHDNPIKNPIINLSIKYYDLKEEPKTLCYIYYDKDGNDINMKIQSENMKWGNDLFAEVEEQLERSLVSNLLYKTRKLNIFSLLPILIALLGFVVGFTLSFLSPNHDNIKLINYLSPNNISKLQINSNKANNTDEKIDFLYKIHAAQLNNIVSKDMPKKNNLSDSIIVIKQYLNWKSFFIILPVLVIVACIIYLLRYCYSGSMFLWGDFIEYYQTILERRKILWSTVIFALSIGIIGNLFVFGLSKVF